MSIASSGVLMACMLMIGIVFSLSANIDNYVSEIQQNAVVMVFFKDDMSRDDALAASEAIKNLDNINDVKFVSKEDGLSSQEDSMGEEYKEIFAILQDDNPFLTALRSPLTTLKNTIRRWRKSAESAVWTSSASAAIMWTSSFPYARP